MVADRILRAYKRESYLNKYIKSFECDISFKQAGIVNVHDFDDRIESVRRIEMLKDRTTNTFSFETMTGYKPFLPSFLKSNFVSEIMNIHNSCKYKPFLYVSHSRVSGNLLQRLSRIRRDSRLHGNDSLSGIKNQVFGF